MEDLVLRVYLRPKSSERISAAALSKSLKIGSMGDVYRDAIEVLWQASLLVAADASSSVG